jgi:hypothetical protein
LEKSTSYEAPHLEGNNAEIKRSKWKWIGHILNNGEVCMERDSLDFYPEGSKSKNEYKL